jgi:hypothetical protein
LSSTRRSGNGSHSLTNDAWSVPRLVGKRISMCTLRMGWKSTPDRAPEPLTDARPSCWHPAIEDQLSSVARRLVGCADFAVILGYTYRPRTNGRRTAANDRLNPQNSHSETSHDPRPPVWTPYWLARPARSRFPSPEARRAISQLPFSTSRATRAFGICSILRPRPSLRSDILCSLNATSAGFATVATKPLGDFREMFYRRAGAN